MSPFSPSFVDVTLESGRPASVSLQLSGGVRIGGIQVWRTANGPRVLMPSRPGSGRPPLEMPPSVREEWKDAILGAWRRAAANATESVSLSGRWAA